MLILEHKGLTFLVLLKKKELFFVEVRKQMKLKLTLVITECFCIEFTLKFISRVAALVNLGYCSVAYSIVLWKGCKPIT